MHVGRQHHRRQLPDQAQIENRRDDLKARLNEIRENRMVEINTRHDEFTERREHFFERLGNAREHVRGRRGFRPHHRAKARALAEELGYTNFGQLVRDIRQHKEELGDIRISDLVRNRAEEVLDRIKTALGLNDAEEITDVIADEAILPNEGQPVEDLIVADQAILPVEVPPVLIADEAVVIEEELTVEETTVTVVDDGPVADEAILPDEGTPVREIKEEEKVADQAIDIDTFNFAKAFEGLELDTSGLNMADIINGDKDAVTTMAERIINSIDQQV